jgi:hypothetical protein
MSEKPTVFQPMDGSAPSELPAGDDITGVPLKPFNEKAEWGDAFAQEGSAVSSVPGADPLGSGAPTPEYGAPETVDPQPEKRRRGKSAQERISQLTRNYRHEQGVNQELNDKLQRLEERLENTERRPPPSRQAAPPPSQETYADYAADSGQDLGRVVADSVRRAVEPLQARLEASEQATKLQRAQAASEQEAARVCPELLDPQSEESAAFRDIWSGDPLRYDPAGPYKVALMVKGAFAEERQTRPARTAKKRAASVVTPGPGTPELDQQPQGQRYDRVIDEGLRRTREGISEPGDYIAIRKAQRRKRGM